jgi:hypothetical protein
MKGFRWVKKLNPLDAIAKRAGKKAVEGAIEAGAEAVTTKETKPVKNWKTSLSGLVGVLAVVVKVINGGEIGAEDIAVVAGLIGLLFAKDKDVTGTGTAATRQP